MPLALVPALVPALVLALPAAAAPVDALVSTPAGLQVLGDGLGLDPAEGAELQAVLRDAAPGATLRLDARGLQAGGDLEITPALIRWMQDLTVWGLDLSVRGGDLVVGPGVGLVLTEGDLTVSGGDLVLLDDSRVVLVDGALVISGGVLDLEGGGALVQVACFGAPLAAAYEECLEDQLALAAANPLHQGQAEVYRVAAAGVCGDGPAPALLVKATGDSEIFGAVVDGATLQALGGELSELDDAGPAR